MSVDVTLSCTVLGVTSEESRLRRDSKDSPCDVVEVVDG
jgi:hypothetical protein